MPENDTDPQRDEADAHDWWSVHMRATVAAALDEDAPEQRFAALRELADLLREAPGPATEQGALITILTNAYGIGLERGRRGAPPEGDAGRQTPELGA